MMRVACGLLVAASLVSPCAGQTTVVKPTEPNVRAGIDRSIAAVVKKDLNGYLRHIAEEAVIVMNGPGKKGRLFKMTKKQYGAALAQGFKSDTDYGYKVTNIEIAIDPDGLGATVSDVVTEKVVKGGNMVDARLCETTILELTDGRPKIN